MDIGWNICLFDVFFGWVGLGPWFLDDLGWILMDFGCMLGWFLDGVLMVLGGFWMDGWICDWRCMEFCFLYVFLIFWIV